MGTIAAVATAISALIGIIEKILAAFKTSQAETDQGIDQQEQANKETAEQEGRPV